MKLKCSFHDLKMTQKEAQILILQHLFCTPNRYAQRIDFKAIFSLIFGLWRLWQDINMGITIKASGASKRL